MADSAPSRDAFATPIWSDLGAAVVLLCVAIPLSLGIAQASEAPLVAGFVAAVIGGVVVGTLSASTISVSGPAAGLILVLSGVQPGIADWSGVLTSICLAGVLQIIAGRLRLGAFADFVPSTVIKGMSAAIGLIIMIKQVPHLLGYDADFEGDETFAQANAENTFSGLWHAFDALTAGPAIVGLMALVTIFAWDAKWRRDQKLLRAVPGALVALVVGIVASEVLQSAGSVYTLANEHLVNVPERATHIREWFDFPRLDGLLPWPVWSLGFTLFAVASLETLLSIRAVDKLDPIHRVTPLNRELQAQGVGNLLSGALGGLPIASVIVRSTVNAAAGAKSKRSAIAQGVLLAACCVFLGRFFNHIPLSVIGAILLFVGGKLISPRIIREQIAAGVDQLVPFVITIVSIVALDLLRGILIGLIAGIFFMLKSNFHTAVSVTNDGKNYLIRLRKDVSFLNKPKLSEHLLALPAGSDVLIDLKRADFIDLDIIELIAEFTASAAVRGIRIEIKADNDRTDVRKRLSRFMSSPPSTEIA